MYRSTFRLILKAFPSTIPESRSIPKSVPLLLFLLMLSCDVLVFPARAQDATETTIFADDFESDPSSRWTIGRESTDPSTFVPRDWTWVHTLPDGVPGSAFFAPDPEAFELCSAPLPGQVGVLLLESPSIALPADSQGGPVLAFDHWVSLEEGFDGGQLMISVNGGPYLQVAPDAFISNGYNLILSGSDNPRVDGPAWSGPMNSWARVIVDLSRYAFPGDTIRLRWDMSTDYCFGTDAGWYVDNVRVYTRPQPTQLLAKIRALPHVVSATLGPSSIPDTFFFSILFEQPVDHSQPNGPTFLQRVTLLHRSETAPTVLSLNGYNISPFASQSELTYFLEGNQIEVEHRFFPPSTPDPLSWKYLTIAQAATDDHQIVESFKRLYSGKWVSTGRSKGGMAAVYHRSFYPSDVDVTVPYVAPSSHGIRDARYVQFMGRLGTAACREKLREFQQGALTRRAELLAMMPPYPFDILGADRALEFAIVETPFAFWQYSRFNSCDAIPAPNASTTELLTFLDYVTGLYFYSDAGLDTLAPYYYQAATELGGPRFDERILHGLLRYPREDVPDNYPPLDVQKDFNRAAMENIEQWVRTSGSRMLFIYGATDPWSASAFEPKPNNDSYCLFVTGYAGDHLAGIFDLSDPDFNFVASKLTQWLNNAPVDIVTKRAHNRNSRKEFAQPTKAELFMR